MNRLRASGVVPAGREVRAREEARPGAMAASGGQAWTGAVAPDGGEAWPGAVAPDGGEAWPEAAAREPRSVDVHQHLWPAELIEALRARRTAPRMREWTLELDGEPDYVVDPADHDIGARAARAASDGLDLALISLSSPLGIETLPAGEAEELLAAYHEGVLGLPAPFGGWAAACLTDIDPPGLARRLEQGFVGLQLPATALLGAAGYERVGRLLDVLESADRPLFIHPGLAGGRRGMGTAAEPQPPWWPAIVPYVQQMHAAWFAFRAYGRPRHPELRVCFAILAGLAPLHGERFAARAGGRNPVDSRAFLEVSSYGTRAVDATIRVLGIDALVNGSDRPYADPVQLDLGAAATSAVRGANPRRLLYPKEVLHEVAVAACA